MNERIQAKEPMPEREQRWCLHWLNNGTFDRWCCPKNGTAGFLNGGLRTFERQRDERQGCEIAVEITT